MYYAYEGQTPPRRNGASHATIYPYGPFAAGDGKTVMLGLQNEREWKAFCDKVLRQPQLATDPRFDANPRRSETPPCWRRSSSRPSAASPPNR
jgi:formyl-CoA transferase